jgi:hypothetical protein
MYIETRRIYLATGFCDEYVLNSTTILANMSV